MTLYYVGNFNVALSMCFIEEGDLMSLLVFHLPIPVLNAGPMCAHSAGRAPAAIKSLWIEKRIYVTTRMAQIWAVQPALITGISHDQPEMITRNNIRPQTKIKIIISNYKISRHPFHPFTHNSDREASVLVLIKAARPICSSLDDEQI